VTSDAAQDVRKQRLPVQLVGVVAGVSAAALVVHQSAPSMVTVGLLSAVYLAIVQQALP